MPPRSHKSALVKSIEKISSSIDQLRYSRPTVRKPQVIGVVGSRRRDDLADQLVLLGKFLEIYQDGDSIVSGGCRKGSDRFAEQIAYERGISITIHYPNYDRDGIPACYFIRNTLIAKDCTILLAVVADDRTGGVEDVIKKTKKMNKPIILV